MNNMNGRVRHSGIVETVDGECVKVRILQASACAHCKISGHCNASDSKEKIVDVRGVADASRFKAGDEVVVYASMNTASQALMLGFGLPFVVLVGVLFCVYALTADEALSALSGIAALIPYYILLWLFRERLAGRMRFGIE